VTSKNVAPVTVYGKPGCGGCLATVKALEAIDVRYTYKDITEEKRAEQEVRALGYTGVPVVRVGDGPKAYHWHGFRPDRIKELAQ
jgi:glutaredoxin-like protein NrdH